MTCTLLHKGSLSQWNVSMGFYSSKKVEKHWYNVYIKQRKVQVDGSRGELSPQPHIHYTIVPAQVDGSAA